MSLKQNDRWIENAEEMFLSYAEDGDIRGMQAVAGDVREQGFIEEAENMDRSVNRARLQANGDLE